MRHRKGRIVARQRHTYRKTETMRHRRTGARCQNQHGYRQGKKWREHAHVFIPQHKHQRPHVCGYPKVMTRNGEQPRYWVEYRHKEMPLNAPRNLDLLIWILFSFYHEASGFHYQEEVCETDVEKETRNDCCPYWHQLDLDPTTDLLETEE